MRAVWEVYCLLHWCYHIYTFMLLYKVEMGVFDGWISSGTGHTAAFLSPAKMFTCFSHLTSCPVDFDMLLLPLQLLHVFMCVHPNTWIRPGHQACPSSSDTWSTPVQCHCGLGKEPGWSYCSRKLRGSKRNIASVQRRSRRGVIRLTESKAGSCRVGELTDGFWLKDMSVSEVNDKGSLGMP